MAPPFRATALLVALALTGADYSEANMVTAHSIPHVDVCLVLLLVLVQVVTH